MASLLERLKQRKLVQWSLAYLAAAYLVYEASWTAAEAWGISVTLVRGTHILLVFGLLVTVVLAWYHGEKGRQRVSGPELLMVATLLVIAGGVLSLLGEDRPAEPASAAAEEDGRPRIAVLPLENLSPDPEDDYFALGVQEDLTSKLTRIPSLAVISRFSVEQYWGADSPPTLPQIARELRADYLIQGSARITGGSVRVSVQLIEGGSGLHVWADDFDAAYSTESFVRIQAEIVQQIAFELRAALSPEDREWLAAVPTHNLEALEAYMRGVEEFRGERLRNVLGTRSIRSFEEAVRLDPGFALAHARLAYSRTHVSPDQRRFEGAREAAERALELAGEIPEARLALDLYYQENANPEEAARQAELAAQIDPEHPWVIRHMARHQAESGAYDAAIETLLRGETLDPANPGHPEFLEGLYAFLHRYDEALDASSRHAASASTPPHQALLGRARIHVLRGELEAARAVAAEFRRSDSPTAPYSLLPNFTGSMVRRIMTAEERQDYFDDYTRRGLERGRHMACDSFYYSQCLRSAIHETEVGSAEKAQVLWDSLRVVIETAPAPVAHYEYEYQAMIYMQVGEAEKALDMARRAVARFSRDGCRVFSARHYNTCTMLMRVLAHFGQHDEAIDIVEEMLPAPSWLSVPRLELDPIFDPLRDQPRFQNLLEKYADDAEH